MNKFASQDFYLSSFLMANNFKLIDYYRKNGFTTFFFEETEEMKTLVNNYYTENTTIEPVRHGRAIKALKSMIHSISTSTSNRGLNNEFDNKFITLIFNFKGHIIFIFANIMII